MAEVDDERHEMTDQLREQAEREIANEMRGKPSERMEYWRGWIRDRCSLLEMRKAAEWIPVSERLPEVGGTYLVRAKMAHPFDESTEMGYFIKFEDGAKWSLTGNFESDEKWLPEYAVTYWQDIPAPPVALEGK